MAKFYKDKYFVTSDNSKINYIDEGIQNTNTILFLHGWNRRGNIFTKLGEELVSSNRIVWLDFRGHGKTKSIDSFNIPTLANDLKELISHLDLNNISIVAYDLGVFVLFQYLIDYGLNHIKSIKLIDMSPKLLNDKDWYNGLYQGNYNILDFQNDISLINKKPKEFLSYYYSQAMPEHINSDSRNIKPTFIYKVLGFLLLNKSNLIYWSQMINADYRDYLSFFDIPTTIIYSRPGSLFTEHVSLYMQCELPNCKLLPIDNATHTNILYKIKATDINP